MDKKISEYMAKIGAKGGSKTSDAKKKSSAANGGKRKTYIAAKIVIRAKDGIDPAEFARWLRELANTVAASPASALVQGMNFNLKKSK